MLNLVEQISIPKCKIIIDESALRSLTSILSKYNLNYKPSRDYYGFTNKYLEVYVSKSGIITLSLLSLPKDTQKAITILDQMDQKIYSIILDGKCEIYKEIFVLENREVRIGELIDKKSHKEGLKSMVIEIASGIRIRLSRYENQFIISFKNYKDVNDLKEIYDSFFNGIELTNIIQIKSDIAF